MTQFVVDASVVVKWVIPDTDAESNVPEALEVLQHIRAGEIDVIQPPHWLAEVAAVLSRLIPSISQQAVSMLYAMRLPVLEDIETYTRACQLSILLDHHLFDTLYHAVALREPETLLLTADDRYYLKAQSLGNMTHIRDFEFSL